MALAILRTRASLGIQAPLITVEVHLGNGLPCFNIVGLPDTSVREARDRVRSALINSHFEFPAKRITVNLAPADLPKDGGRFDLAIAIGIIAASGQIPLTQLKDLELVGELALSGQIRPVSGILPFALATKKQNRTLIVPQENIAEALAPYGIEGHEAGDCFNVFMNVDLDSQGGFNVQIPQTRAGDHIDLRAEMDVVAALSACPNESGPVNNFRAKPLGMTVYAP